MDYEAREALKAEGWKLFSDAQTVGGKVQALMHYIIKAHYWRAREQIESRRDYKKCLKKLFPNSYCIGYEMDIDRYTEHWLFANKEQPFMTEEIFEECCHWYEPKESKYLPKNCTDYQI